MKYHLLPADQRHLIKTDRTRPRTPISIPKVHKHTHTVTHTPLYKMALNKDTCIFTLYIAAICLVIYFLLETELLVFKLTNADCEHEQVMIVVGGQAPKAIRSVACYDFQEDRWYQVADLPSRRCRAGQPVFCVSVSEFFVVLSDNSIFLLLC